MQALPPPVPRVTQQTPIGFDFESWCHGPAQKLPKPVCLAIAGQGFAPVLLAGEAMRTEVGRLLEQRLVGHGIVYDLGLIVAHMPEYTEAVFRGLDEGRFKCTEFRQRLIEIGQGRYKGKGGQVPVRGVSGSSDLGELWEDDDGDDDEESVAKRAHKWKGSYALDAVLERELGMQHSKDNPWRTSFGLLEGVPVTDYPIEASRYVLRDADSPIHLWRKQEESRFYLAPEDAVLRGHFALRLVSAYGIRTDSASIDALEARIQRRYARTREICKRYGLVHPDKVIFAKIPSKRRVDPGAKNTKAVQQRVEWAFWKVGYQPPRTEPTDKHPDGQISTARATLLDARDKVLRVYAEMVSLGRVLDSDIPKLRRGIWMPIHTRFGMAETLRSTSSDPNIQNPPRTPGVRECFRARAGKILVAVDFGMLELVTLAQNCIDRFGWSHLADALNAGVDPHMWVASLICNVSYEWAKANSGDKAIKRARQIAKVLNFGFPGGMGIAKFVAFAKAQGVHLTEAQVKEYKQLWFKAWPEMRLHFEYAAQLGEIDQSVHMPRSGFFRGNIGFTQICNTQFQSPGATIALEALYQVVKQCYLTPGSLLGSRVVNFVHDEIIVECDIGREHEVAQAVRETMLAVARHFLPNVKITASVTAMQVWAKQAEEVLDQDGKLVPWQQLDGDKNEPAIVVWADEVAHKLPFLQLVDTRESRQQLAERVATQWVQQQKKPVTASYVWGKKQYAYKAAA